MKSSLFVCAAIGIAVAMAPLRAAHAQTPSWRCDGVDCEESLINDIEDTTTAHWPGSVNVSMPPIGYACTLASEPDWENPILEGEIDWSFVFSGSLSSFLVGRHSASADLAGTMRTSGNVSAGPGTGLSIHYVYGESSADVPAPGGSTGVSDLGGVQSQLAGGDFWSGSINFNIPIRNGVKVCQVGVGALGFQVTGAGTRIPVSVAISSLPVASSMAEAMRNQFRSAVRLVVTGAP